MLDDDLSVVAGGCSRQAAKARANGREFADCLVNSVADQLRRLLQADVIGVAPIFCELLQNVAALRGDDEFGFRSAAVNAENQSIAQVSEQIVHQNAEEIRNAQKILQIRRRNAALPIGNRLRAHVHLLGEGALRDPLLLAKLLKPISDEFDV